ncbi:GGDEF domain-containing protein [Devosia sp. A449]
MSAAAFVLAINLFVAGIFATAFGVVAAYQRSAIGARWLAFSYGFGALYMVLEFILPYQDDHRLVSFGIFAVFLIALASGVIGLAHHYRLVPPWRPLLALIGASLLLNLSILDMERESALRNLLYQLPYFLVQVVGIAVLSRLPKKRALDIALFCLYLGVALHFLAKPIMAMAIGSGAAPQDYLASNYAAYSQTLGAVLLITNGLLTLLIIVRDVMAEMTARSETDTLSGLFNRRGFEERASRLLRRGTPGAMVVADLDHFKTINDSFGHEAGDLVITAFGNVLTATADTRAVVGRLGGEEFAVFMPGANLAMARLYAEGVRSGFTGLSLAHLGSNRQASASFGVAQLVPGDSLSDLLRRADAALYHAKANGRDRVSTGDEAALTRTSGLSA